jgi:hypothetical protein
MKTDRTALDADILNAVRAGKNTFSLIEDACRVAARARAGTRQARYPTLRELDGRLQAARKAGKITYERKAGWRLAPPVVGKPA